MGVGVVQITIKLRANITFMTNASEAKSSLHWKHNVCPGFGGWQTLLKKGVSLKGTIFTPMRNFQVLGTTKGGHSNKAQCMSRLRRRADSLEEGGESQRNYIHAAIFRSWVQPKVGTQTNVL